ncbi:S1 RNA-binding domain-containing protein [uncultured Eubacterium sp.]|uniref:S1 RNA-binding domain-containing protein n=1 Tax=uncultured Eubacterium sp. TaxID=165185 RepID=UPI0025FAAA80|nr:S1 RNA-binding domain-containing protein [uncultured Eubacterium sp.]
MNYYPEGINFTDRKFATVNEIKSAIASGEIIEGKVLLCDKEHNLHIDLGIMSGIIPRCEGALGIEEETVRDIALISKVNKPVAFKIVAVRQDDYGNDYAVLSRRIVQLECMRDYISPLECGDIITARVTHLERFGAFIDIGAGINSLIPIDMLSVSRISHPRERVYIGQIIQTVLRKKEEHKMTFSLKELLGTWEENAEMFGVGETVTGVVRSIETYGVFVELAPNLAGLAEPCKNLEPGQRVSVFIKSILPDKMKVKLVIVEAFDDFDSPAELSYFIDSGRISHWKYSPDNAIKLIETKF